MRCTRRPRCTPRCRLLQPGAGSAALDASAETLGALPRLWLDLAEAASAAGAAVPGSAAHHAAVEGAATLPQLWYSIAEAAAAAPGAPPRDDGWLTPIAQGLDWLLLWFQAQLNAAHVPYASGWAIVCLTLVTKTLTFPFTKIQARPCFRAHEERCFLLLCPSLHAPSILSESWTAGPAPGP